MVEPLDVLTPRQQAQLKALAEAAETLAALTSDDLEQDVEHAKKVLPGAHVPSTGESGSVLIHAPANRVWSFVSKTSAVQVLSLGWLLG